MANAGNLKPCRTKEEARVRGTNGGIASGKARQFKAIVQRLLRSTCTDADLLAKIGPDFDDGVIDYKTVVSIALIRAAASGDVKAIKELRGVIGEDIETKEYELRKRNELPPAAPVARIVDDI